MKRFVLIVLFLAIGQMHGMAQLSRAKFGLTFSAFGKANLFNNHDVLGGGRYDWKSSYAFGLTYSKPIYKWLYFESGIDVSKHKFNYISFIGLTENVHTIETTTIISIPITLRINFLKYLFVNGGGLYSFTPSSTDSMLDQQGLGLIAGFGANYNFKSGFSVFVNPYQKFHALVNFPAEKGSRYRMNETGVRFGVTYTIPNKH